MDLGGIQIRALTIVTSDYLIQELLRNPKPDHRANTLAMTEYAGPSTFR